MPDLSMRGVGNSIDNEETLSARLQPSKDYARDNRYTSSVVAIVWVASPVLQAIEELARQVLNKY